MSKNVLVNWKLPTTRESGRPLAATDIDYVDVQMSADGGTNFASIGKFKPDVLETTVTELEPGDWFFRGLVVDKSGRASSPLAKSIKIEDDSAPSALASLTVTLQ